MQEPLDNDLRISIRKIEAQEANARKRTLILTLFPIVLAITFFVVIGQSMAQTRRELAAKNEELNKSQEDLKGLQEELARYTQPSRVNEELEKFQSERMDAFKALTAALNSATNIHNEMANANKSFASDVSQVERRLQVFTDGLQPKIDEINKRLAAIRKEMEINRARREEEVKKGNLSHPPLAGPSQEESQFETLNDALISQREILTDMLGRAKRYQSDVSKMNQSMKEALDKSNAFLLELDAKDQSIIELGKVASSK